MKNLLEQKNKNIKGFTLVEVLVAIAIFTISILSIMVLLGGSISNTTYAKQRMTATYLAQEGIEYMRNMRDSYVLYPAYGLSWDNPQGGFIGVISGCVSGSECGFALPETPGDYAVFQCSSRPSKCELSYTNGSYNDNITTNSLSGFTRQITVDNQGLSPDEIHIVSKVSWKEGTGIQSVSFAENLFNWE